MVVKKDYILGTSDKEIQRLEFQHEVWADSVYPLWEQAEFGEGHEILDLGCGPGFASLDLAEVVGSRGTVHAVDGSQKYIEYLAGRVKESEIENVRVYASDVHELDLSDSSLDGAFARWVLCFVNSPETVVAEAVRVLRPGGSLVIMDYFNYLSVNIFPERESFKRLFKAFHHSLIDHGGSYDIGQHLPEMVCRCRMEIVSLQPICRIARPSSNTWEWLRRFTKGFMPKLKEEGYLTDADEKRIWSDWQKASLDPATFFFPPPIIGIVARKQED